MPALWGGKDAFHRVPIFDPNHSREAVERILSGTVTFADEVRLPAGDGGGTECALPRDICFGGDAKALKRTTEKPARAGIRLSPTTER